MQTNFYKTALWNLLCHWMWTEVTEIPRSAQNQKVHIWEKLVQTISVHTRKRLQNSNIGSTTKKSCGTSDIPNSGVVFKWKCAAWHTVNTRWTGSMSNPRIEPWTFNKRYKKMAELTRSFIFGKWKFSKLVSSGNFAYLDQMFYPYVRMVFSVEEWL